MPRKKKVLLPDTMAAEGWNAIRRRSDVEAIPFPFDLPVAEFHRLLADVEAVALSLTRFGEQEIKAAAKIRIVARHGVGYDMVDVPALTRHGIPLMVTGTANSPSVAEQALSFMLSLAKREAAFDAMVKEKRWKQRLSEPLPVDLFGRTVLIVGFGRIGTRVAKMCRAFEMEVTVYDPYVSATAVTMAGCRPEPDLDAALPRADFVSIHCPKTPETIGMFNMQRLSAMKPSAFLVNTARGGIIDEAALHRALSTGVIRGAGIDVFDREPPADDNPLLRLPNILAAPHMAGVTRESLDRMAVSVVENILSVLDGTPNLDNVVNREVFAHR